MRFLETLQRNGFKGASEHAGKLCGNFQYQLPAGGGIFHHRDPPRSHGYPYRLIGLILTLKCRSCSGQGPDSNAP